MRAALPLAAVNPSPLWFATRGAGVVTLVALTLVVVLGISTSLRWEGKRTPRFVVATVHRNLSLFALVLLAVHISTSVLDPFAGITSKDAVVPFTGAYRTFWLGLGVVASEVMAAVALTSLVRARIGHRLWRVIHWTAYAAWPLAVVHGLGTGSDAQEPWMIAVTAACALAVLLALSDRLVAGRWRTIPIRLAAAVTAVVCVVAGCTWAATGPLQPGWAVKAGTPASILSGGASKPTPRSERSGFQDPLIGSMIMTRAGAEISLRDTVDTSLVITIMPPGPAQTLPVLTVYRAGKTACSVAARAVRTVYAVCGATRLVISLYGGASHLTGRLVTSGPIR